MTETSPDSTMPESSPARDRKMPAHGRAAPNHGALKAIALVIVGLLAFGGTAAATGVYRIQHMATTVDVSDLISPVTPNDATPAEDTDSGHDLNILVLGTDDRSGENGVLSGDTSEGMRADTTMLVHISEDRDRVEVVSIPRDSMVEIPECRTTSGTVLGPLNRAMFNSAFARGWDSGLDLASAAACTINTVQHNTGVTIDHFVVVDFAGYKNMVDALGGIDIDIPEDISVKKVGGFKLTAGRHHLDGTDALKLVRARSGTGWGLQVGSDLKRIERQQAVVNATFETAQAKNFLTDLPKLTGFLTSAVSSLTMNPELSKNLVGLATSMTGISSSDIEFISVPVTDDPLDKNRVVWTPAADELWVQLRQDLPSTGDEPPVETEPVSPTTSDN